MGLFSRNRLLELASDPTGDTVDFDFSYRDLIPQTTQNKHTWAPYPYKWGASRNEDFPELVIPDSVDDPVAFKRQRTVAVAKKYLGLKYEHAHIPAFGLDCSNLELHLFIDARGEDGEKVPEV